jgi:hypothetical protein
VSDFRDGGGPDDEYDDDLPANEQKSSIRGGTTLHNRQQPYCIHSRLSAAIANARQLDRGDANDAWRFAQ